MIYRVLGATGLRISEVSFGAGPVPALLTEPGDEKIQWATIQCALDSGINWFDTAPTYGAGQSEIHLGHILAEIGAANRVHVATKVRLTSGDLGRINDAVKESLEGSLKRLRRDRVTLLQLHNAITKSREDEPMSIAPNDVTGSGGVLEVFKELKEAGLIEHFGLTGIGETESLLEVIGAGSWATVQLPVNILQPNGARGDRVRSLCADRGIAILAIRVLAGGALAGQSPSAHTRRTRFFPLTLFQEDQKIAATMSRNLPSALSLRESAVRYVLSDPKISTALIGFADPFQVEEAVRFAAAGPLPPELLERVLKDFSE